MTTPKLKAGDVRTWTPDPRSTPGPPNYPERAGQPVTITGPATDVLPGLKWARFPDGTTTPAFPEELGA